MSKNVSRKLEKFITIGNSNYIKTFTLRKVSFALNFKVLNPRMVQ